MHQQNLKQTTQIPNTSTIMPRPLTTASRRLRRSSTRTSSNSTSKHKKNHGDKENTVNTTTRACSRTTDKDEDKDRTSELNSNSSYSPSVSKDDTPSTPIRPTPYHQVIAEGRVMSPRLTRSAKKGKRKIDKNDDDEDESSNQVSSGLLVFSPPTEEHAREYEEKVAEQQRKVEKERQLRIQNMRRKNLLDISPPKQKKQRTNAKQKKDKIFYLEFSPGGSYMGDPSKLELCLSHNELQAAFKQLTEKYEESVVRKKLVDGELSQQKFFTKAKENEITMLQETITNLETKMSSIEVVDTKKNHDGLATLQQELKETKDDARHRSQTFDLTIHTLTANLENSKEEVIELKKIAAEKIEVDKKLAQVEAQVEVLTVELEKSRQSRGDISDAKYEEILSAIHSNTSKQDEDKDLKATIITMKLKCDQLLEERGTSQKKLKKLESLCDKLKDDSDKRRNELQVTLGMYDDALKEIESARELYADLEKSSTAKENKLKENISCIQAEASSSKDAKADYFKLKSKYEALEAELDLIRQDSCGLKRNNNILQTEIATIQAELRTTENSFKSEKEFNKDNVNKLSNMKEVENSMKEEIGKLLNELSTIKAQLEIVTAKNSNENKIRLKLESSVTRAENQIKSLGEELVKTKTESKLVQCELVAAKSEKYAAIERLSTFNERETEYIRQISILEEVRKSLHNQVMQLSGNIRVFVRVRPVLPGESDSQVSRTETSHKEIKRKSMVQHKRSSSSSHLSKETQTKTLTPFHFPHVTSRSVDKESATSLSCNNLTKNLIELVEPSSDKGRGGLKERLKKHRFGFDGIFSPDDDQQAIWSAVEPLVQSSIDGYNATLFAYGQTGSGKTFTMLGGDKVGTEGIIRRALRKVFIAKADIETKKSSKQSLSVAIEMIEVYNEQIRDLLHGQQLSDEGKFSQVVMEADNEDVVMRLLEKAQERRCVRATKSNSESSRSHLLFTIHLTLFSKDQMAYKSKLNICDLAGSERLNKSGSAGVSLRETQNINSSLSVLSNVIEKLQAGSAHVPFRDSKLTYLLSNSLTGDSKTLAIVCCNPLTEHYHESLCSLRFASKVAKVELKAKSLVIV